jgi:CheY-like chemotaxis protein
MHCILIAEDCASIRHLTAAVLRPQGYHILQARDGQEALNISHGYLGKIDLLLTDVNMPNVSGHELAKAIKQQRPGIRILILSSDSESAFPPDAVHHTDAVMKPISPKQLIQKVKELLTI